MKQVEIAGSVLTIRDGELSSDNKIVLDAATAELELTFGRFNNDEIYPDRDAAIAQFLVDELRARIINTKEEEEA